MSDSGKKVFLSDAKKIKLSMLDGCLALMIEAKDTGAIPQEDRALFFQTCAQSKLFKEVTVETLQEIHRLKKRELQRERAAFVHQMLMFMILVGYELGTRVSAQFGIQSDNTEHADGGQTSPVVEPEYDSETHSGMATPTE